MNYCFKCGNKLHQEDQFCVNCGADVNRTRGDLIHFTCNNCNTKYSAKPEREGNKGTCKTCGELIVVPNSQRTPRFDIPKFDEAPALVSQTETSWETTCPTCIFFQEETDVCKKFSFNLRDYPKKFADKCNGKFYKKETEYGIGADHISTQNESENPPLSQMLADTPHPWIRYFARFYDIVLSGFILGILAGFIYPPLLDINATVFGFISLFFWVFVEAFCLSTWGTTPGKSLFKIKIFYSHANKFTFSAALNRSFQVWFGALGLGIPIISLITLITTHNRLTKNGRTAYDENVGCVVKHGHLGIHRIIIIILQFVIFLALIAYW